MFCAVQKPYLLILANLQSNKQLKKETLRFSLRFVAYMHLSKGKISHFPFPIIVERNLSQSQILKGIQDKNTVAPKDFFGDFQR